MAVVLIPAMLRTGFAFRPVVDFRHPAVRQLLKLSAWTLGFVAANQISLIVVRNLAGPGSGDATAYLAAFTFFVLPHGLLAVSIATTFQPEMARAVARKERPAFIDQASLGIRMTALLTIPAGVGIFVLRRPIVGALLQRGQFDALDAANTSRALAGFALGLGAFSIYMFTLRGFYAHKDTRTPFVINVVENLFNIVLAVLLVDRFGVLGLGLAFAIAYVVSSVWALQVLSYKVPGLLARVDRQGDRADAARCGLDGRGRVARGPSGGWRFRTRRRRRVSPSARSSGSSSTPASSSRWEPRNSTSSGDDSRLADQRPRGPAVGSTHDRGREEVVEVASRRSSNDIRTTRPRRSCNSNRPSSRRRTSTSG